MAHYAFLDENNVVTEVIVGRDEYEVVDGVSDWETYYGSVRGQVCKRTSYNSSFRKNYATVGAVYDESRDAFIPNKPFPSWILNEETCTWSAPVNRPETDALHMWDESSLNWKAV
jgi:hypothetical protein